MRQQTSVFVDWSILSRLSQVYNSNGDTWLNMERFLMVIFQNLMFIVSMLSLDYIFLK